MRTTISWFVVLRRLIVKKRLSTFPWEASVPREASVPMIARPLEFVWQCAVKQAQNKPRQMMEIVFNEALLL